jgi:hypothetical protein
MPVAQSTPIKRETLHMFSTVERSVCSMPLSALLLDLHDVRTVSRPDHAVFVCVTIFKELQVRPGIGCTSDTMRS